MGHVFSHLSKTDRYKIEALLNQGHTKREIADELHVHISTIYREIKRARWQYLDGDTWITEDRYNPDGAEKEIPRKPRRKRRTAENRARL